MITLMNPAQRAALLRFGEGRCLDTGRCEFKRTNLPSADQSGVSGPPPDASTLEPTTFLRFPAVLIAEQLTKIETVSSHI